jgi:hypothetical protein
MKRKIKKVSSGEGIAKGIPLVYIILVNWNGLADTIDCLESLKKITYDNYRIVIVDNASSGNDVEVLEQRYGNYVHIIRNPENLGFVGGNNRGIDYALHEKADYVLLLNNDTVVDPEFLTHLVRTMTRDGRIGVSGSKIYFEHDRRLIWFAGGRNILFNRRYVHYGQNEIDDGRYDEEREVHFITGCVLLIRAGLLQKIGGLDEDYFSYVEDNDLCHRVKRLGYSINYIPKSVVYHKGNKSTRGAGFIHVYYRTRNRLLFIKKTLHGPAKYSFYLYWLGVFLGRSTKSLMRGRYRVPLTIYYGVKDFALGRYGKQWGTIERILNLPTKGDMRRAILGRLPIVAAHYLVSAYDFLYPQRHIRVMKERRRELQSVLAHMKPDDSVTQARIGILSFGGIGDLLMVSAFGRALRRKHPDAYITLFFDSDTGRELSEMYGVFDDFTVFGSQQNTRYLVRNLYQHFDIFYDTYRITRTYYGTKRFIHEKDETDRLFTEYNVGNFYRYRPARADRLARLNEHTILVMMKSAGLPGSLDDIRVSLPERHRTIGPPAGTRYAVVSHGSNRRITTHPRQVSTKNWDVGKWEEVVRYLHGRGIAVVQVGEKENEPIEGAVSYLGKTDIITTAAIIRGAEFYMGTEGGLSHLAAAMGTPSVVLFGPTSVDFFGYPNNVNIQNDRCTNCWWSRLDWFNSCPKGYDPPLCMTLLSTEEVENAIDTLLGARPAGKGRS